MSEFNIYHNIEHLNGDTSEHIKLPSYPYPENSVAFFDNNDEAETSLPTEEMSDAEIAEMRAELDGNNHENTFSVAELSDAEIAEGQAALAENMPSSDSAVAAARAAVESVYEQMPPS